MVPRYLEIPIRQDLEEKMVFLTGPRQVGKTTLAGSLLKGPHDRYYNWDRREDRKRILAARWPAVNCTVVLDELHKHLLGASFPLRFAEHIIPERRLFSYKNSMLFSHKLRWSPHLKTGTA